MKSTLLAILLFLLTYSQSIACYNEYNIKLSGQGRLNMDESTRLSFFYRSFDLEFAEYYVASVDLTNKESYNYKDLSDVSIQLCRLGRVEEALDLLIWLEEQYPDEYKIVANLGTTYELAGKPKMAEKYLLKAIQMNHNSHHGSEWFHLRILNAKQLWNNDVNWLLRNKVLNLDTQKEVNHDDDDYEKYIDTAYHIKIQLKERIPFTPEDDIIMAKVLVEYGDYLALHFSVRHAAVIYRIAETYDKNDLFDLSTKITRMDKIVMKNKEKFFDKETSETLFKKYFPNKDKFRKINRDYIDEIKRDSTKIKTQVETIIPEPKSNSNRKYGLLIGMSIVALGLFFLFFRRKFRT